MKDECAGTPIAEYIGLRPKLYSVLKADEQLIKRRKKYVIIKRSTLKTTKMHSSKNKRSHTQ